MRNRYLFIRIAILITSFSITTLQAQVSAGGGAIIIDTSISTQSLPRIRVAQNGWIFAGFVSNSNKDYRIFRSEDGGNTWIKIVDNNLLLSDWDLEVTGSTDATIQLWVSTIFQSNSMSVDAYNGATGNPIHKLGWGPLSGVTCANVAIATDYKNPGFAANPYSMAVAISLNGVTSDSVLLFISNDSGSTWKHSNVDTSINYFHRLSLAYGYSPVKDSGIFFLAGEYNYAKSSSDNNQDIFYLWEQEDLSGVVGPAYIDSVDIDWATNISHPDVIVENSSFFENDSLDLSAMILFNINEGLSDNTNSGIRAITTMTLTKDTPSYKRWHKNHILSAYNNNGVSTTANGVFNPANESFVFAAGDTANDMLNYYELNYDSIGINKDTGDYVPYKVIYADTRFNLGYANPHCDFNPMTSMPVADWVGDTASTTFTLFDAKDTTLYTDTGSGISYIMEQPLMNLFPNPAYQYVNIVLTRALSSNTQIDIYDLIGQKIYESPETHSTCIRLDVSKWITGIYYIRLLNGTSEQIEKFTVVH